MRTAKQCQNLALRQKTYKMFIWAALIFIHHFGVSEIFMQEQLCDTDETSIGR